MSVTSPDIARDEILTRFKTDWDALTPAVNGGTVPPVQYDNVIQDNPPPGEPAPPWARVTVRHTNPGLESFGPIGGTRRRERFGLVTVQIFTKVGPGLLLADLLSKIARDSFEGKSTPSGVWFRNVRINEIGKSGSSWQTNVVGEFVYDEVK